MKSFARSQFFRVFDRLIRPARAAAGERLWTVEGVDWRETRESSTTPDYVVTLDIVTGERRGRNGWSLMVVREGWWAGAVTDPFRSSQWAHLLSGKRTDALEWFERLEAANRQEGA